MSLDRYTNSSIQIGVRSGASPNTSTRRESLKVYSASKAGIGTNKSSSADVNEKATPNSSTTARRAETGAATRPSKRTPRRRPATSGVEGYNKYYSFPSSRVFARVFFPSSLLDLRVILDVDTTHTFFFSAQKRAHTYPLLSSTRARVFFPF